ncbi:MAG: LTA synthase family protein [Proteobacteria bacterium]|nr:LTA synthase family protein [Pseudomonadota bacterium]
MKGTRAKRGEAVRPERRGLLAAAMIEAGVLGVAYAAEAVAFKALELGQQGGGASATDVFRAAAPDLALAAVFVVALGVLLSIPSRLVRIAGGVVGYAAIAAALVVNAASHGYFAATGSPLSLSSIDVWASNAREINTVIAGEALTWKLPLVVAQVAFALVAAVAFRLPPIRRRLAGRGALSRRAAIAAVAIPAAFFVAAVAAPPLEGKRMGLSRSVPLSVAAEVGRGIAGDEVAAVKEEPPTSLVFSEAPGAPRPNVVVIVFESLNWKSSDVYVEGRNATPFLAEIASKSLVVDTQYTVVPHTSKAIVSILCGLTPYPGSKRIESTPGILPKKCMAHVLRGQGYKTAFFQPATDFEERSQLVKNMGFETFRGLADFKTAGFEKTSYFGREDKIMLAPSLEWVDKVKGEPFFLTLLTLASHHNYVTPQSFPRADYPEEDPDQRNYLNAIRYIDDFVRGVFEGFEKRGLLDDTVFLIVGDHGEAFAEHGRRQHDLIMWEEGLRSAALIHGPRFLPPPGRVEGVRSHLDLVPTVADLLGLEAKEGSFEGQSLLAPVPDDRKLFHACWFNNQCAAVREGPIKTIYHYESQPMEVYNDAVDELERDDLAGKDLYGEPFLASRKKEILEWKASIERRYRDWEKGLAVGRVLKAPPEIANRISARFGDSIELVGYEVSPLALEAGGDVRAKYVFKCLKKPPAGAELFVHVLKDKGGYLNADHEPVGGAYPIRKWRPGEYVVDEHSVHIPADWAGERARLAVGFWNEKSDKRFEVAGEGLEISDNRLVLINAQVKGSRARATLGAEAIRRKVGPWVGPVRPAFAQPLGDVFGDAVELVGVTVRRADVKLAGTVEVDYVFLSIAPVGAWKLVVALVPEAEGGKPIKGDHDPIGGLFPPNLWRPGEYVVDRHSIHIDMYKSKVGKYGLWIGFQEGGRPVPVSGKSRTDERGRVYLGEVTINPRTERQ